MIDNNSMNAAAVAAGLGYGWNLGNTLDAHGGNASGLNTETLWGNPRASKELIALIKKSGFSSVRIPITWYQHLGPAPEYKIDYNWMKRVKEVASLVLDANMYAIINIHHDGDGEQWLRPDIDSGDKPAMYAKFEAIWKQIAAEFAATGGKLLFEGMNEFHSGFGDPPDEWLKTTDELNQLFVDTVRASGGVNEKRILIVPSYNTNPWAALKMTIPNDTIENALIVEVHSYDPWSFAGEGKGTWGTDEDKAEVDRRLDALVSHFGEKGIPVIMGEYGVVIQADKASRLAHIEYTTEALIKRGIAPFWWDDGGGFAITNRKSNRISDNAALEAIIKSNTGSRN
jgi:aryl-phospho-beta-D-glucosidase BglC (GH1 family)